MLEDYKTKVVKNNILISALTTIWSNKQLDICKKRYRQLKLIYKDLILILKKKLNNILSNKYKILQTKKVIIEI